MTEGQALMAQQKNRLLQKELQAIRDELHLLNNHRLVRDLNSLRRTVGLQFLRGIAFGLGSVVGATIVVSLLISVLSQIEFIPIIGEWAIQVMQEIQPAIPGKASSPPDS